MTLSALGIFSAAGAGGAAFTSDYELISTTILGSSAASVTFSSLGTYSSTYKHLQIRFLARKTANTGPITLALNGSGLSYVHSLTGTGSSVVSSATSGNGSIGVGLFSPTFVANNFGVHVFDVLDVYSTSKNKTIRGLTGYVDPVESRINLTSGLWNSTASLTSLEIVSVGSGVNFDVGSRFSLYGLRG